MALIWALFVASSAVVLVSSTPHYMVVAPDKLGPYSDYSAAVTVVGTDKPVTITVELKGEDYQKTSTVTVEPDSTQIAKFQVNNHDTTFYFCVVTTAYYALHALEGVKPGQFNLTVKGENENFKIENTTVVRFVDKFQSVFIQTDRAMYKPGHKVQFRVLVLDTHLKPSALNKIDVILKDGQNNRVKEWKNVEAVKGLYSNEVQLSAQPVLGDWTIVVKSSGKEVTKSFTVAEYVLPKFEVSVEVPTYATVAHSKVPVTVSAKYTYGQLVKGEATIKLKNSQFYYTETPLKENSKVIKVDPVGTTEIDVVQTLGIDDLKWDATINFDVEFKEDLTGKVLNGTASLTLHKNDFKMNIEGVSKHLVPGEDYKAVLKVTNWDDSPFVDPKNNNVRVRSGQYGFWLERENATWDEHKLPSNGILEITIPTNENDTIVHIEAEYLNSSTHHSGYKKFEEEVKNTTLELKIPSSKPKIGDTIDVEISIKGEVPFLSYYLVGRKELIESKIIKISGQDKINLKLPVTQAMARNAHLLVAYITNGGEILAEEKRIEVESVMDNYVKLSASPNETEPGKETVINVESKPNSLIGLMGVDQSVILLKKGNDLSTSDVEIDLNGYDYTWYGNSGSWRRKRRTIIPWPPRSSTKIAFDNAGMTVLTNAYIHEERHPVYYPEALGAAGISTMPVNEFISTTALPSAPFVSEGTSAPVVVRTKFPETWIWDTLDSRFDVNAATEYNLHHEVILNQRTPNAEIIGKILLQNTYLMPGYSWGEAIDIRYSLEISSPKRQQQSPHHTGIPGNPLSKKQTMITVRRIFPETWIWDLIDMSDIVPVEEYEDEELMSGAWSSSMGSPDINFAVTVRTIFPETWIWHVTDSRTSAVTDVSLHISHGEFTVVAFGSGGSSALVDSIEDRIEVSKPVYRPQPPSQPVRPASSTSEQAIVVRSKFPETWIWDIIDSSYIGVRGFGGPGVQTKSALSTTIMRKKPQSFKSDKKGIAKKETITVRSKFPETWMWDVVDSSADGKTSVRKTVPDTITSWVITGFSISPEHGLGLSQDPAKVKVFRPFFVSLNLPYSVTRGESIAIPVNVFNYMDQAVKADVKLENTGWFVFANASASTEKKTKREAETSRTKTIEIGPNSAATANFVITPKELGYLEVKVTATSPLAGDGVSRKLLVKPEGETQYRSKGVFIDLRDKRELKTDVKLDIPDDIVLDSEHIEATAVGDLLGSALDNLDKLIKIPYGCGEQNMLNFVPNIVILDYLKSSQQLTDKIESNALKYIDMGYQRELSYKHKDNSYSAFGESDPSGSTWLTAFVAKSFNQAKKFVDIETSAVIEPLKWIASKQNPNGSFSEVGHVSHKAMQGGASEGLALTAYVLSAFVETMEVTVEFKDTVDKAAKYVNEQIEKNSADTYSVAVAAYALGLANHPAKDKAFELLESRAKSGGDLKWWEKEKEETENKEKVNPWETWIPNAINVEITSYAMLSYLQKNKTTEAIPILRWLLSQQNSEGGFASTQDTVVALGAIAKLAKEMGGKGKDLSIKFQYAPDGSTELKVNDDNSLLFQKAELPSRKVRQVSIDAKGNGFAVVQISYRYNVDKKGAFPSFKLDIKTGDSSKEHLMLDICTSYTGGKESNMAVMEVTLPSGYTIDDDGIKALRLTENIKKVETKDDDTVVILYFDKVTSENLCSTVLAYRTFKIADQRPVPITIYDYYDNSKRATEFYSVPPTKLCDICEGEDCKSCDNKV